MTKDDIFDVVVKGFGVYLVVLAIIALPKALEGILLILGLCNVFDEELGKIATTLRASAVSTALTSVIKIVLYLVVAANFLKGGSWLKKLTPKAASEKKSAPPDLKDNT